MDYMDSNKIGQRIENKLIHALGRTISEATNDEIYKAAAECIRDDIMIKDYMRHIGKHSGRWDLILIRSRMKKMMQDLETED